MTLEERVGQLVMVPLLAGSDPNSKDMRRPAIVSSSPPIRRVVRYSI